MRIVREVHPRVPCTKDFKMVLNASLCDYPHIKSLRKVNNMSAYALGFKKYIWTILDCGRTH